MATKRRGQNEGTISQRKDGRWEARITTGYRNGKQVRKCIYGKTRQEVADQLGEYLIKVRKGQSLPNERITVEAFLLEWLDTAAKSRLSLRTHLRYAELLKLHVIPTLGRTPVARLSANQVQVLITNLNKTLSARTVVQVRAVLRTALKHAIRYGLAYQNAASMADPPRVDKFTPVFLDEAQAKALLVAVNGTSLEALVTLALTTGLRMGEILGLSWQDVDLANDRLHVRRQQQVIGGKPMLTDTKTAKSDRYVDLPKIASEALERHRLRQILEEMPAAGGEWVGSGRVFCDTKGGPLLNWNVLRQFHRVCAQANLPKMRLHDLRHSCATILLANGVHPRIVMEILGHATIAMTMNVYGHAMPSVLKDAAGTMNNALK